MFFGEDDLLYPDEINKMHYKWTDVYQQTLDSIRTYKHMYYWLQHEKNDFFYQQTKALFLELHPVV